MKNIGKILVAILLLSVGVLSVPAQNLTVRTMKPDASDLTACIHERLDLNNRPCALVKVQIPLEGMQFEGSIIQPVEYKAGEYWVYMPSNTKMIKIKHPSFKPLFVRFTDYDGVGALQAKVTYVLDLDRTASATAVQQMEEVTFKVTPAGASLFVDDVERDLSDGVLKLQLACGPHRCTITHPGYRGQSDEFEVKAGAVNKRIYELDPKSGTPSSASAAMTQMSASTPTPAASVAPTAVPASNNESGQNALLTTASGGEIETFTVNGVTFEMVRVDGGTFMMGSDEQLAYDWEKPAHSEKVATFHISRTEVTQELWQAVMGSNPSYFRGENLPVGNITWDDCQSFCEQLSQLTGRQFRLPTEAEWEYAARGGKHSRGYLYCGGDYLDDLGWYRGNSDKSIHPVGSKQANELGIYDMSGNVLEWTSDLWSQGYRHKRNGGLSHNSRVCRGGEWSSGGWYCRTTSRIGVPKDFRSDCYGLRLAL